MYGDWKEPVVSAEKGQFGCSRGSYSGIRYKGKGGGVKWQLDY